MLTLFSLMRANPWQILWHFKIPVSLPYFYAGLRVSVSYAFITTVVSEWLGGFEGLGVYMIQSKKLFQYDTMFAIIILVSIISLLGMKLVDISEKYVIKWNVRRIRRFQKRKEEIKMKKTWKVFLTLVTAFVAVVLVACGQGTASKDNKEAELKKIDFILDWTPNTNHTGFMWPRKKVISKKLEWMLI